MTRETTAGEIAMVIEEIRDIAKDELGGATDHAEDSKSTFADVGVGVGDFSDVPMARELALQHKAAHEVFLETIRGVVSDLEDFRTQLLACADGHEATDDSVHAGLLRMGRSSTSHEYHSKRNFDHGRRKQGSALDPGHGAGASSLDSGSHSTDADHSSSSSTGSHGGTGY